MNAIDAAPSSAPTRSRNGVDGPVPVPAPAPAPDVAGLNALVVNTAPWAYQSLYVAAKLGLADLLADGPRGSAALAAASGAHPDALYRFCRALAGLGVLREEPNRVFALTPIGAALRSDAPRGLRYFIIVNGEESFRAWADVLHTVRTGSPAFDHVYGQSHFAYLAERADASAAFNRMAGRGAPSDIIEHCDFVDDRRVVDVGGGMGGLLAHVLSRHPQLTGVLLDTPAGVAEAAALLDERGVGDRAEVVGGDFFAAVPAGGDSYLLSRVLHDWDDAAALRILRAVRAAMRPGARLIVIDKVIPEVPGFHPGKFSDLQMLVVLGGRERTGPELAALLDAAGFAVTNVYTPTVDADAPWAETLIEAVVADDMQEE